jgi:hypothetical protein
MAEPRFKGGIPVNTAATPAVKKPRFAGGIPVKTAEAPSLLQNASDQLSAGFTSGVRSIPFVGPQVLGGLEYLKGMAQGRSAEDVAASDRQQADENPIASTIGSVAGPMIALAPLGMTGMGAKLLGMSGSLGARIGYGMGSGALIGGGDALARTGSPQEALHGAEMGAALGGVLPAAGAGVRGAWRGLTGNSFDPAEKALARALSSDKIAPADVQTRLDALGPDAVLADLGPNLQRQAGALASLPGDAQTTVRDALRSRAEGSNRRIQADTNATLGRAPVPSRIESGIQANMDALSPEYRQVFQGARAVDTQPLANDLDTEIVNLRGDAQRAVRQVRSMLNIEGAPEHLDPSPYTLFQTRQAIDGMLETEANTKVIAALTRARQQVDGILAQAVPGLKTVDAKFEELANQRSALGRGQQALDSGRTAVRPEELQAEMVQSAVPERGVGPSAVPFRLSQGGRAEIERIIGTTANNLTALKSALKGDGSWNRDRLASFFGEDKADRLLHILERERTYDATNQIVTKNSETAARTMAQREFDTDSVKPPHDLTWEGAVAMALQKTANVGASLRRGSTNSKVADALMSRNPSPKTISAVSRALLERGHPSWIAPATLPLAITVHGGRK